MQLKTSLEHLPEAKRAELARVVELLFSAFEVATANGTSAHKRNAKILKVVLFGSYARGDWVDDPIGGYTSDYDLLVVVNHEKLTGIEDYWKAADERLTTLTLAHELSAPVNFIVHSLADVNAQLRRGRPFFTDIVRDGIAIFQAPGSLFDAPVDLTPIEALNEARAHFVEWFPSASNFRVLADDARARGMNKEAAFLFHQATERLYHSLLLVLTLYSPKSHKLNFLRSQCEQHEASLAEAWPRETRFQQRCFELLRRAYVDARYSPHYKISGEELDWISTRVLVLEELVKAACEAKLSALQKLAAPESRTGP